MSMKTDFKTIKELHEYYAKNNQCKLKYTATQPVYEVKPPSSGIVFIGEAPGRNEDLQGRPFVGQAGKFLNELLESIGYSRDEVYVSNVVKYRPPENREPLDSEKEACRVWLNAELLYIKPRIIVTLGRHALSRFVPNSSITASHGELFEHQSHIPIFSMYHPAAALYNPNLKQVMFEDFKKLKEFLDSTKNNSPQKIEQINDILNL